MPTLDEALDATTIANIGHIYYAPVGTPWPDLSTFEFTGEDWGAWKWLGDTSAENLPEFEADEDEDANKRTWDRKNTRNGGKITGTINGVALTKEFFSITKSGGKEEADGYVTTIRTTSKAWKILIVVEDGAWATGLGLYVAALKAGLRTHDLENYTEVPVNVTAEPDAEGNLYKDFLAVKMTAVAGEAPGVGG
ncbi:hypothetical protein [Rothia nasimurium]|uniref:phage tail tube protein n=1 Tax=Rothia nasimurium TaxID=85336 RepID=UPI001F40961E|nr:hypothetical protein [Rothia nasimurium]